MQVKKGSVTYRWGRTIFSFLNNMQEYPFGEKENEGMFVQIK